MPPENIDARIWAALLGAIGAGISMQFVKGLTWAQKVAMVGTGVVLAVVFTPLVIELMALPTGWSDGIAALIGILGWAIVGSAIITIQKADWWGLISDVIRRWTGRA